MGPNYFPLPEQLSASTDTSSTLILFGRARLRRIDGLATMTVDASADQGYNTATTRLLVLAVTAAWQLLPLVVGGQAKTKTN